jgi:hypothetical protein
MKGSVTPAAWDLHSSTCCALGNFNNINLYDNRKMDVSSTVPNAHTGMIR